MVSSRKMSTCLLPRVRRFRGPNPKVPESRSLVPHRHQNLEVSGKFPEDPSSAKTEPRREARLNLSKFPRHLTLVYRFITIP
jgi:hypothetical protein